MLLHGINDDILISNPSYSGVYQYETEKLELYKEINIYFRLEPSKKTAETVVQITHAIINI